MADKTPTPEQVNTLAQWVFMGKWLLAIFLAVLIGTLIYGCLLIPSGTSTFSLQPQPNCQPKFQEQKHEPNDPAH